MKIWIWRTRFRRKRKITNSGEPSNQNEPNQTKKAQNQGLNWKRTHDKKARHQKSTKPRKKHKKHQTAASKLPHNWKHSYSKHINWPDFSFPPKHKSNDEEPTNALCSDKSYSFNNLWTLKVSAITEDIVIEYVESTSLMHFT